MFIVCALLLVFSYGFYSIYKSHGPREDPVHKGNLTYDSIKNDYTALYTIDNLPTNLDTVDFSTAIKWNAEKRRHVLSLPHAGTITDIIISDTLFYAVDHNSKAIVYSEGSFYVNEPVLLDIGKLQKGKYHVHILGCSIGGVFSLIVER